MRVNFVPRRDDSPRGALAEAEIYFDASGPFRGLKLVGFTIWASGEGEVYCTFPSKAFGVGKDRRYFDYVRPADTDSLGREAAKRLKVWIVGEYQTYRDAQIKALGVTRGEAPHEGEAR